MNTLYHRDNIECHFVLSWHEPKVDKLMSVCGTRAVHECYPTTCDNLHSDCMRILDMVDNLEKGAMLVPICDDYDYPVIDVEFYAYSYDKYQEFRVSLTLSYEDCAPVQAQMTVYADMGTSQYDEVKSAECWCCEGWGLWNTIRKGMLSVFGMPV